VSWRTAAASARSCSPATSAWRHADHPRPDAAWDPAHAVDYVSPSRPTAIARTPIAPRPRPLFREVVARALGDGGKVLIPAFAIGRTQEILYELEPAHRAGRAAADPGGDRRAAVGVGDPLYARHRGCTTRTRWRRWRAAITRSSSTR
jgi:hypothetical protein